MEFIDLLLDNGELVRVEVKEENFDEACDSIEFTMKRRDWWSPNQFDGCKAEYLGHLTSRINMGRVVGML